MPYPDRNRDIPISKYVATNSQTSTLLLPAPGAGKSYLFRVQMTNGGATPSDNYVLSASSTTIHVRTYCAAGGGGSGPSVWCVSDPNNQINFFTGAASTTQSCMIEAYIIGAS